LVKPRTALGVEENASAPPSPSWFAELSPQQRTVPSTISAHENLFPAATATAFWIAGTWSGTEESAVPPICPRPPAPQHETCPLTVRPHVWRSPTEMATKGPSNVPPRGTRMGWLLAVKVPLPSWPRELSPQQCALPLESTAQA